MRSISKHNGYFVAPNGEVWSNKSGALKKLKPILNSGGYPIVRLCADNKQFNALVHILVADAYIPNPDNLPCVLHKDDDPSNPHVDNLFRGTQADNMQDCLAKGRNTRLKRCKVTTPEGIVFEFNSLKLAAKTLNFNLNSVYKTLSIGRCYYRGFKIEKL